MDDEVHGPYKQAMERGDRDGVRAALAEGILLHSPVTPKPFVGRDAVAHVLGSILEIFEDLRFDAPVSTAPFVVLPFRARIGDRDLQGVDLLRFDEDGLIAEFTVMVRPLTGLLALQNQMGPRFGAAPLQLVAG